VETLAKDVDVSPHSLCRWVAGRRSPEPGNIRKLADVLEERSKKLATIAEQLRRAAKTRL
jgi:predicted transcriptional regulator